MNTLRYITCAALLSMACAAYAEPSVQVGFSPEGSARKLVLETTEVARQYVAHWQSRWDLGKPYPAR